MRVHPITAALAVAGVLAGAHAGIAAISETKDSNTAPIAQQSDLPPAPEMQPQANAEVPAADAPVAQAPVDALPKGVPMPGASPGTLQSIAARDRDDEYQVRIPFTNRTIRVTVPTFPHTTSEVGETAPSVIAYFEQKNRDTQLAGGPQPVFPTGGNDDMVAAPYVVAHFERREGVRLAALKAQQEAQQAAQQAAAAALAPPASVVDTQSTQPTAAAGSTPVPQTPGG